MPRGRSGLGVGSRGGEEGQVSPLLYAPIDPKTDLCPH